MMEKQGSQYKILLASPSGLSRKQILVDFSSAYDRIPHPDTILEESINEIWEHRTRENPSLYNGTKFRYAGYIFQEIDSSDEDSYLCLHLGLTDYKTFMGTNLNPLWEKFLVPSEDDIIQCQYMSGPLGNGAVIETEDGKILVLQRSQNVGEFPGYFVFPGGHSEPQEIGISSHENFSLKKLDIDQMVSQEMFDGIIREVIEEIGVPVETLSEPIFIGIARREMNVRPTAFFFLKCKLDSESIQCLYASAKDNYESTNLHAFSRQDLGDISLAMPGCHRGGFALYELMMETSTT